MGLATDYRPTRFKDLVGQRLIVKPLMTAAKSGAHRSFIFEGPSGTGKTTAARILANKVGAKGSSVIERDAATYSGVDAVRELTSNVNYRPVNSKAKVVILDEAHRLSRAAFDALLKPIEEPPSHVWWVLCTTESRKLPVMIKNRCIPFRFKAVDPDDLATLLETVAGKAGLKVSDKIIGAIADESGGSPRRALTFLESCQKAKSVDEAMDLMQGVIDESEPVLELCRALGKGAAWGKLMKLLKAINDGSNTTAEGVRVQVVNYFGAVAINSKEPPPSALAVLDAFADPYPDSPGMYPLILSIASLFEE